MTEIDRRIYDLADLIGYKIIDRLHVINMATGEYVVDGTEWNPLTNIAHAFEVVEKMNKDGWYFNFSQLQDVDGGKRWFCELDKDEILEDENAPPEMQNKLIPHHYYELDVSAKTLPMAIYLAALKAKGEG